MVRHFQVEVPYEARLPGKPKAFAKRRETGIYCDEGVGAARLAAILAGESPVSRGVQSLL